MREFIYYSQTAVTSGKLLSKAEDNLMKAGRMDIVCNVIISAFFLSHGIREDVKLHLILDGPPNPPAHLIFTYHPDIPFSKKDIAGLIKRMLYKLPADQEKKITVFPGCEVEKKSFEALIKELDSEGKNIFLLEKRGKDIRELKIKGNEVFIIGDQNGFPKSKDKFLKQIDKISVSPKILFASQVFVILHNELDRASTV